MAKHLTDKDIADVIDVLDDWPTDSKLTWDRLVETLEGSCRLTTTRQTLQKQSRIKSAFNEVKNIISGATRKKTAGLPPSLQIASERISKQQRTIERLEAENNQLLEQFHTWLYNATRGGITIEQLNDPLVSKRQ
jgi:tryptophan 2,3-dioxygenase